MSHTSSLLKLSCSLSSLQTAKTQIPSDWLTVKNLSLNTKFVSIGILCHLRFCGFCRLFSIGRKGKLSVLWMMSSSALTSLYLTWIVNDLVSSSYKKSILCSLMSSLNDNVTAPSLILTKFIIFPLSKIFLGYPLHGGRFLVPTPKEVPNTSRAIFILLGSMIRIMDIYLIDDLDSNAKSLYWWTFVWYLWYVKGGISQQRYLHASKEKKGCHQCLAKLILSFTWHHSPNNFLETE